MDEQSAENDAVYDAEHTHLRERLLPVLNDAVGNRQLTRDEAFAVLAWACPHDWAPGTHCRYCGRPAPTRVIPPGKSD
jgi:hypothetical protein